MTRPDIHDILSGIGQTEDIGGWWETSAGAEFGQRKMQEVEACVNAAVAVEREQCAKRFATHDCIRMAEYAYGWRHDVYDAIRKGGQS